MVWESSCFFFIFFYGNRGIVGIIGDEDYLEGSFLWRFGMGY